MGFPRDGFAKLREQYGCGPVQLSGTDEALYERHLIFDNILKPTAIGLLTTAREKTNSDHRIA